jgi:hypothetical protein
LISHLAQASFNLGFMFFVYISLILVLKAVYISALVSGFAHNVLIASTPILASSFNVLIQRSAICFLLAPVISLNNASGLAENGFIFCANAPIPLNTGLATTHTATQLGVTSHSDTTPNLAVSVQPITAAFKYENNLGLSLANWINLGEFLIASSINQSQPGHTAVAAISVQNSHALVVNASGSTPKFSCILSFVSSPSFLRCSANVGNPFSLANSSILSNPNLNGDNEFNAESF